MTLGCTDVHTDAVDDDGDPTNDPMLCRDCHSTGDLHGDGTSYVSMLEPTAIDAECVDCHATLPDDHGDYDPHAGKLHCKACHTGSVVSCYNCRFDSLVEGHQKRARQPIHDFVMLVNGHEDEKVRPARFQSLHYEHENASWAAFAPYTAHTITSEGRVCEECHVNFGGSNETIEEYNSTGLIRFAEWDDDTSTLAWDHGIVPIPEDYLERLRMDFITDTGDPSDPPGPSPLWDAVGKDVWDGSQMFYADPLSREQMAKLGFATVVPFDMRPGSCPKPFFPWSGATIEAVILGTADLDVLEIDVATLQIEGVSVLASEIVDVGTPSAEAGICVCSDSAPDGFDDLRVWIAAADLCLAIMLYPPARSGSWRSPGT